MFTQIYYGIHKLSQSIFIQEKNSWITNTHEKEKQQSCQWATRLARLIIVGGKLIEALRSVLVECWSRTVRYCLAYSSCGGNRTQAVFFLNLPVLASLNLTLSVCTCRLSLFSSPLEGLRPRPRPRPLGMVSCFAHILRQSSSAGNCWF